jgi:hypothetical protein
MTTPDRTDELIRAMLDRRASQQMPDWLFDRTMHAVLVAPQVRRSRSPWQVPPSTAGRLALVAAMALLLTLVAAGALLAAGVLRLPPAPPRFPAAVVAAPSPSPSSGVEPSLDVPVGAVPPTPQVTPKPAPKALAADSLAVVTAAGDGLRVRSAPGTGTDSKKLDPLLPKGTRMFIVDGPVAANGMDWYEVKASHDEGLFGWVSSGKNGEQWIRKSAPKCPDKLDETAVWKVPAMDFLLCYGDAPITLSAVSWEYGGIDTGEGGEYCPWTGADSFCSLEPEWLSRDRYFEYGQGGSGDESGIAVVAPDAYSEPGIGPPARRVMLTLAMDAPESAGCRVLDGRGRDVVPAEQAILGCRLTFVVREMEWEPVDEVLAAPSLATVTVDELTLWDETGGTATGATLRAGTSVLVAEGPEWDGLVAWYQVVPSDSVAGPAGWAPLEDAEGRRTLEPAAIDCPLSTDWAGIEQRTPAERLACFGGSAITVDVRVTQESADPGRGLCADYLASTGSDRPCVALPGWLTTYSGVVAADRAGVGRGIELKFDPRSFDRDFLPTDAADMRLTGRFGSDTAWECSARDAETNALLIPDAVSIASCRQVFEITSLEYAN